MSATPPMVSIVIPTYKRAGLLGMTLESFVNQEYPKNRYEIVVADNNSPDHTREVVSAWQAKSAVAIKYVFEERQGVHYARNSAGLHTIGEILYYTDDDMIADRMLLAEIVKCFEADPRVGAATGRVLPKWEAPPPDWMLKIFELNPLNQGWYSLNDQGDKFYVSDEDVNVWSCHQAMTREAFFRAGGFNPENTAGEWVGDGETGLNNQIKALGYRFAYNGRSVIHHMIPPERLTQEYLNKRLANQGSAESYVAYRQQVYGNRELSQQIQQHANRLIHHSAAAVQHRLAGNPQWHLEKAQACYCLARIEYDLRLMQDARWRGFVLKNDWMKEAKIPLNETQRQACAEEIQKMLAAFGGARQD